MVGPLRLSFRAVYSKVAVYPNIKVFYGICICFELTVLYDSVSLE